MAKKLNKAVVAAVASVALLGGGAYMASNQIKNLIRPIGKIIAAGDAAAAAGDWDLATANYARAAGRAGSDAALQLKFVDAFDYTVRGDLDKYRTLRSMQSQLLANDPRSVPVLRRVLAFQKSDVQSSPGDNAAVRAYTNTAQRLLTLVPNDRDARVALIIAVLEPYQRNLEVKADDVDKQRDEADKLFEEKSDDSEAIRMAASFRHVGAIHALQQGDYADAQARAKANVAFIDAARDRAPTNPGVWLSRADIYRDAISMIAGNDSDQRDADAKEFYESLIKANDLVKPGDPLMLSIRSTALRQMELADPKNAEAGYRKLLEELPNDRQPRLMLAEFLARQPARRDDAVAILDTPFKPTKPAHAIESLTHKIFGLIEQVRRTSIRLTALGSVADAADRKKRLDLIETEFRGLNSDPDINARFKAALLRIQGGIEAAQGKLAEAVTSLDTAKKQLNADSPSSVEQDIYNDVILELAQVQLRLGQTGEARPLLTELVTRKPENFGARLVLSDLLIRERSFEPAEQQVAILEKYAGKLPDVKQLRLMLDSLKGDTLKKRYKDLPETTRDERTLKIKTAGTLQMPDEIKRLTGLILAADPGDFEAVASLTRALIFTNETDKAVAVIKAAQQAKPDDNRFKVLLENVAADTPAKRRQLILDRINALTDPYEKSLAQGELARSDGKPGDAIEFYKTAEKLNAQDPRAFEAHFQAATSARRFSDAEALLPDLTRLNADQADGALRRVQLAGARAAVEPDPAKRDTMFREVAVQAQKVAQERRELGAALQLYAQVLVQTGDYNGAIEQFNQALDKTPANLDARVGLVDVYMRADRRSEAREQLNKASEGQNVNDPRVKELELTYQLRYGDPIKAIASLQKQAEDSPDDLAATARYAYALDQAANSREKPEEKQAMVARAADVYSKAAAKFPQDLRFLVGFMDTTRRAGKPEAAIEAIEKVAADPANKGKPEIAAMLAEQYVRSGRMDDAARVLSDLIKTVQPPPADVVQQLALIQIRQNKLADAMATLDLRADDAGVQRQRVAMLLDVGDLAGARAAMETALKSHPDPDTLLLATYIEIRAADYDKAEALANRVLAARPNDPGAYYYRAQAKLSRKPPDYDSIRDDLVRSRDLAPSNVDVRATLADVLRTHGDSDQALTELQAAWNIDHTSKMVLTRLVEAYTRSAPPQWTAAAKAIDDAKATPRLAKDPEVLLLEADTYVRRNDAPRAIAAARAALAINPENFPLQQRYFDILLRAKAFRDVLSETANSVGPTVPQAWWFNHLRAAAFLGVDQKAAAKKSLDTAFDLATTTTDSQAISMVARTIAEGFGVKEAAARLDPYADPSLQALAGELLHDGNEIAASIAKLEPMLNDPKLPPSVLRRVQTTLGSDYLQISPVQPVKARALFEALLKQTPDDVSSLNNLACVLMYPESGGTPADSLKPAQRAYELIAKTDAGMLGQVVQDTYGWALVKTGKVSDGLDMLRHASEDARFPDVFLHLTETYLMTDNLDAAESSLSDAKTQFDNAEKNHQPPDPAMKARFDQLTADLAKRKAAPPK